MPDAVDRVQAGQDPTKVYTAKGSQNPPSLLPVIPGTASSPDRGPAGRAGRSSGDRSSGVGLTCSSRSGRSRRVTAGFAVERITYGHLGG